MKKMLLSAIVAALAVPSMALAQEEGSNTGAINFGADLNFTTSYFFRGYNQEDRGLIFQPNVYGTTTFVDSDNVDLSAKIGTWNSVHSKKTGGDEIWFESDLYAILTGVINDTYTINLGYTLYTYPGDAFESVQELGLSASVELTGFWDDSDAKTFTLPVEIGTYKETDDGNGDEDWYWEVKVTPTFTFADELNSTFGAPTLTLPIVLGGSFDGYYLDDDGDHENFGYVSVGAAVGVPVNFLPAKYGSWTLNGGVNYIYLIADSAELANDGGEDYELQGWVGLSWAY